MTIYLVMANGQAQEMRWMIKTKEIIQKATLAQQQAANPSHSVWVSASAGTGKTRILTQRVLRLLLQNVPAHRILCITFTKAAAAEMNDRIQESLALWAGFDDESLAQELYKLTGHPPHDADLNKARRLFAEVLESPGGMRIQTIHSFCQQILGRFPVEAGIPPNFSVADESESQKLLEEARNEIIMKAELGQQGHKEYQELANAVNILLDDGSEYELTELLNKATRLRNEILALIRKTTSQDIRQYLGELLNIDPQKNIDDISHDYLQGLSLRSSSLKALMEAFDAKGSKPEKAEKLPILEQFLSTSDEQINLLEDWKSLFFTTENKRRKLGRFPTKAVKAYLPEAEDIIIAEQEALEVFMEQKAAFFTLERSMAFTYLSGEVLRCWQRRKLEKMLLDYDDLIDKTAALLSDDDSQPSPKRNIDWVHYKLDEGIDHILVDEAQDTSPSQWQIITKLANVFFEGDGRLEQYKRSLFVVGDYKQSIYSFQGARPEYFRKIQEQYLALNVQNINLVTNFRSTPPILAFTDGVFNHSLPTSIMNNRAKDGVIAHNEDDLYHQPVRMEQNGGVEIWPLLSVEEKNKLAFTFPPQLDDSGSIYEKMAETVAMRIDQMLRQGFYVSSKKRPCQYKDFLILVRKRHPLVQPLTKALKKYDIPTAGSDRLNILEHIAVQDLLAIAHFMLQPSDDYSLACALRSPLFEIDEDDLYALSYKRSSTLFEALKAKQNQNERFKEAFDKLSYLRQIVDFRTAFEFFSEVLAQQGYENMLTRLGDEAKDALNEFLDFCLTWEKRNPPLLETFMRSLDSNAINIKREYENNESFNAVRIMTTHGSKGLQAPIVILPDTNMAPTKKSNEIELYPYRNEKGQDIELILWTKGKEKPEVMLGLEQDQKSDQLKESHRLLYVALTRAEDYLIMGGWEESQTEKEERNYTWYDHISHAQKQAGLDFKAAPHIHLPYFGDKSVQILSHMPQKNEAFVSDTLKPEHQAILPSYFTEAPASESQPYKPLTPGLVHDEDMAARSPLDDISLAHIFNRGLIIHKLFELLPQMPLLERKKAAQNYLCRKIWNLSEKQQNQIMGEVFAILEDSEFSSLFSPKALAEVPISGIIDKNVISGRIDRLLVTDKDIYIVDFKTNRKPPQNPQDVPLIYIKQLRIYKQLLSEVYPHKNIHTALLWTDNCNLMIMNGFL